VTHISDPRLSALPYYPPLYDPAFKIQGLIPSAPRAPDSLSTVTVASYMDTAPPITPFLPVVPVSDTAPLRPPPWPPRAPSLRRCQSRIRLSPFRATTAFSGQTMALSLPRCSSADLVAYPSHSMVRHFFHTAYHSRKPYQPLP